MLPGIIDHRPACRRCSGVRLNVDCVGCGAEAELCSGGLCQRCVLEETAQWLLTDHKTGLIAPQLQVIVEALTDIETGAKKDALRARVAELTAHHDVP